MTPTSPSVYGGPFSSPTLTDSDGPFNKQKRVFPFKILRPNPSLDYPEGRGVYQGRDCGSLVGDTCHLGPSLVESSSPTTATWDPVRPHLSTPVARRPSPKARPSGSTPPGSSRDPTRPRVYQGEDPTCGRPGRGVWGLFEGDWTGKPTRWSSGRSETPGDSGPGGSRRRSVYRGVPRPSAGPDLLGTRKTSTTPPTGPGVYGLVVGLSRLRV